MTAVYVTIYRIILLICPEHIYEQRTNLLGRGGGGGSYIQEEKYFNLQSVKLIFVSFFQDKGCISAFFMSCKMYNMFKVNKKDTILFKVNKVKNKYTVDIALASLFNFEHISFLVTAFLLLT